MRMATVSRFAIFPHRSEGGVPSNAEKICRGLCAPIMKLYFRRNAETIEDHFYKGGGVFFCALAHGHSMPVGNFFLMVLGETSQGTRKIFAGGCAVQMVKLFSSLYEKTVENHFYKGLVFLVLRMGKYAGLQFFPHGSPQGKPKEFTGGCAVQMVKLYIRHSKKRSKITFIRVCFFLCTGAWPQ